MQLARFQLEQGLPEAADNSLNEASALCEAGSFNKIVVAGEQAWLTAIGVDELPALKTASDEAYQWPSRTVLQSREAAILRLRLGKLYWILGGEYRTSKEFCQTACLQSVQLDPSLAGNYTQLGQYYRLLGDGPRARKCFQKAISLDLEREVAAAQELADIHMEASEIQEARALYEQVAALLFILWVSFLSLGGNVEPDDALGPQATGLAPTVDRQGLDGCPDRASGRPAHQRTGHRVLARAGRGVP